MNYTDEQLKVALAKMLPETVCYCSPQGTRGLHWLPRNNTDLYHYSVRDTELLHLCWLVEDYGCDTVPFNASWQQRVVALAKAKEIEI